MNVGALINWNPYSSDVFRRVIDKLTYSTKLNSTQLNRPPKGGYKRKEANSLYIYISPFLKYTVNLSFKSVNRVRINY